MDTLGDHWTVVTRDRMPSVHVEHTLALTAQGVQIITADEGAFEDEPVSPASGSHWACWTARQSGYNSAFDALVDCPASDYCGDLPELSGPYSGTGGP